MPGRLVGARRPAEQIAAQEQCAQPVAQEPQPGVTGLLRMELGCASGPFSIAATKGAPCSAHVTRGAMERLGGHQVPAPAPRRSGRSRSAGRRCRRTAPTPQAPPRCSSPCGAGRRRAAPRRHRATPPALGRHAVLHAALEQDLHPDADAQDRASAGQPMVDDLRTADGAEAGHARGERTHPRDHQPVGGHRRAEVGGDLDLGADLLEGRWRPTGGSRSRSPGRRPCSSREAHEGHDQAQCHQRPQPEPRRPCPSGGTGPPRRPSTRPGTAPSPRS